MNLLSAILFLLILLLLVPTSFLIRFVYRSIKKADINRNQKVVITSIIGLVCVLVFTYAVIEVRSVDSGYHHSIGQYMISGISGIEVKKRSFDLEDPVPIKFSYGHIKHSIYEEDREIIIGHRIEVFLIEFPSAGEEDKVILYTKEFDGVEFFSDENKVSTGLINIAFENNYKQNHGLDIDFGDIDFDGRIIVRVTQIFYMQDNIDGEIVSTEVEEYEQSYLYFKIDGDRVVFSTSR